jgi:hypothetical protein
MAPAILPAASIKPNIPAWKRLGLKLKSAQPASPPYAAPAVVAPAATEPKEKRKREASDQESPHVKRVKNSVKIHEPTTDTTPNQSPITSVHKRRKSVTFTPETKTEDGDSVKQLYNGWVLKHQTIGLNSHDLSSKSASKTTPPLQSTEQIDSAIDEVLQEVKAAKKPKKEKKPKKSKLFKVQKVVRPERQLDPALSYLKQFHESRDTWKFNKIHQINLLKNAFDIEKIPSAYIEIFYKYVAGLKGGARKQLRDAAIAVKIKDMEEFTDEAAQSLDSTTLEPHLEGHHAENEALAAHEGPSQIGDEESVLQSLSDLTIKKRVAKRMRAERILDELAQEEHGSDREVNVSSESIKDEERDRDSQKRLKMTDGSTQKVRRKRKQRTNAVEDSSSSESSESESSSDDDPDDEPEQTEEESSSSSSSSSSASEDEGDDTESSEGESGSNESE